MRILVTGGAGYIGSTAAHILLERGYDVTVLDNLSTGKKKLVAQGARFVEGSILDKNAIQLGLGECEAVMHFGAKSLVGESVAKPEIYWQTNVTGTATLLTAMRGMKVKKLVFSSTAATYGEPKVVPITEESETNPTNPYGASKLAVDHMLTSETIAYGLGAISLRYFNVAGAYKAKDRWIVEDHDPETHLIPNLLKSTAQSPMKVFGTDWPTKDGTCIRDYVHVTDLIDAHIAALEKVVAGKHEIVNIGSGGGYSVKEVISAANAVIGHELPVENSDRRAGDPAVLIADISKAASLLNWKPTRDIKAMVSDAWESINASTRK
jgi:UDP-glucose 4-epimerase